MRSPTARGSCIEGRLSKAQSLALTGACRPAEVARALSGSPAPPVITPIALETSLSIWLPDALDATLRGRSSKASNMPSSHSKESNVAQPDLVVIRIPEEDLIVYGQMHSTEREITVEGIAEGLDQHSARFLNFKELSGFSNRGGPFWLERILVPSSTVSVDPRLPSTIVLKAYTLYSGAFDPRCTPIASAEIALTDLPSLAFNATKQEGMNEPPLFASGSEILCETDDYVLELSGSFEDDFNLTAQHLSVRFHESRAHTFALKLLDQAACLLQLLTASTLETNHVRYGTDDGFAKHWRFSGPEARIGSPANWLERPGRIVLLLRSLMPKWLASTAGAHGLHRVQVFLGTPFRSTMEGRFLAYCQSFEDLNSIRVPRRRLIPDDEFKALVLDALEPVVEKLPGSDLRRRIRRSVADANRVGLEDRLRGALVQPPFWLSRVQEHFPDVLKAIAKRRNDLSHGDPHGAVHSNADANTLNLQSSLMCLFSLTELLHLADDDATRIEQLVGSSEEASHVVWLAGQMKSGELGA